MFWPLDGVDDSGTFNGKRGSVLTLFHQRFRRTKLLLVLRQLSSSSHDVAYLNNCYKVTEGVS